VELELELELELEVTVFSRAFFKVRLIFSLSFLSLSH
jgi:hypothetical protein